MEYDALWVDWKRSLPKLRHSNLLHVFPEARKLMKQTAKQELKVLNRNLDLYQDAETRVADMISKIPLYERETWFGLTEVFISEKIEQLQHEVKKLVFFLATLKGAKIINKVTPRDIEEAKQVSITDFLETKRSNVVTCPFHEDTTPSFKYYEKQNTWWCFAENIGGDVIDFIQKKHNIGFIAAINFLNGKPSR